MAVAGEKKSRSHFDGESGSEREAKDARHDKANVQPLICFDDCIEPETARPDAVFGAQTDDAQIVHEQAPDERSENGVEDKPHEGVVEVLEGEHFHQRAGEIEKVVHELQRPADEGERVDERARPKKQNDQKGNADVGPGSERSFRENGTGVVGQKRKGQALDDAGKRQLDVNNDLIQLAAAGGRRFHPASRSWSWGRMSTLSRGPAAAGSPRFGAEAMFVARRRSGVATARWLFRRAEVRSAEKILPREDDVFFRPGVDLLTMRAGQLVVLQRRVRVEIFIDRETGRSELRCGRASD